MAIDAAEITGVVLAGGRGARMGGADKGLQLLDGTPLALHALRRLQPQVGKVMVNANRHLSDYAAFGVLVCSDTLADYAGPLAGFASALQHCSTPYLVTVACDTPCFPIDLVQRLGDELERSGSDIAMPTTLEPGAAGEHQLFRQPVFCLLRRSLLSDLTLFTAGGGRKIDAWTSRHKTALVPFEVPEAFFNVNTLPDLLALQA